MSNCKKLPYFEGLTDETIKQGSVFDPTEGVKAYDGYDEEIEYTYSPQELDTCLVGSQVIQYRASQTSEGDMLPNICIPDGLALALPSICDDYESTTAERIIRIIKANDPTIYGIPQVTVARGTAFNVLDGVTAVDDNGNPITDITYSGTLDKEVSGDIISIDDGDERYPVESLKVTLEPIQDLNGYDKPWAGGAEKNVFDLKPYDGHVYAGLTYTLQENGKLRVKGTCTSEGWNYETTGITFPHHGINAGDNIYLYTNTRLFMRFYDANNTLVGDSQAYSATIPTTAVRAVVFIYPKNTVCNVGDVFDNELEFCISKVQLSSFEPYSNICPIDGWTEANTHMTGVNVWDEEWEVGGIDPNTGAPYTATDRIRSKNYIPIIANNEYFFKTGANGQTAWRLTLAYYDADKNFISVAYARNATKSIPIGSRFMRFMTTSGYGTTYNNDICINYPSTDHDYHAYLGTTYTTALGRTVYGGTLDVVSGELVVDRAIVDLGTLNWMKYTASGNYIYGTTGIGTDVNADANPICSAYDGVTSVQSNAQAYNRGNGTCCFLSSGDKRFYVRDDALIDLDAVSFKTAMNGVQLVYELATPQTIQLTPQQVTLLTGDNNVWSDGQVTMVYSVDIPTDGSVTYPLEGEYEITYSAEDQCGNIGTATRTIIVTAPTTNNLLSQNTEDNTESEVTE